MEDGWTEVLADEFEMTYFQQLRTFVKEEYALARSQPGAARIFPQANEVFKAFDSSPFNSTKLVIIGQDPYHGANQAHGLCFSVKDGVAFPPSLRNIFKELKNDLGQDPPLSGNLTRWAQQGVLLLNSVLTVREGQPASHAGKGWEQFTDAAIRALAERKQGVVFLLWGAYAQRKGAFIDPQKHLVLKAAHPSPLSAHNGFFGCRHFSTSNAFLIANRTEPIDW